MNNIYKVVWNNKKSCWQAVAEIASGHAKTKSNKSNATAGSSDISPNKIFQSFIVKPIAFALAIAFSGVALAEPTGGQVTAGAGTISQAGAVTTINQATQNMAIDWHTFNIKANEAVNFKQPNANAIALNRVTGTESSHIMGSLSANGKVFILNPNGVLFGASAQVNVGGLVATTLNLSNENFMNNNFHFTGNSAGIIDNQGNINVPNGGKVALIAPVVKNSGTIVANQGSVLLASAQDVTLTLQDGSLLSYTLNTGAVQGLIDSGGLIKADAGYVVLTSKGLDSLSKSVINHTGIIEAQTVASKNGVVELLGDMQTGTLNMAGKIDASAPANKNQNGGNGGFVETSAAKVKVADSANVTTLAANGNAGTWLIDPTNFTVAATGGDMTGQAVKNALAGGNFTIDSDNGASGTGGNVYINDAISWSANTLNIIADNNIYINKNLDGSGTAQLAFYYGVGTANGGTSDYFINGAKINLPEGLNFATKKGLNGAFTPYQVITRLGVAGDTSTTTLQGMKNNLSGNYVLGEDIDASVTSGWNGGTGFQPVGQSGSEFTGKFDGLGHAVNNLYINRPTVDGVGLFGYLGQLASISDDSTIKNLGVTNANISGKSYVGAIAGYISGDITTGYSTGTVTGYSHVGGLVGFNRGDISQSYSNANVTGTNYYIGGLVGDQGGIAINYAQNPYIIAGGTIKNSYATGNASGLAYVGGLAGYNYGAIVTSYSTGAVNTANYGGLVGYSDPSYRYADPQFTNAWPVSSYWDTQISGASGSAGGIGKTTAQMRQQATYVGWDFNNVWRINEGSSYPVLRALTQGTIVVDPTKSNLGVTAPNDVNKVYDGVAVNTQNQLSQLTGWNGGASVDGLLGGDTAATVFNGGFSYGGTWQGAVNAGNYTIVTSATLNSSFAQKYEVIFTDGSLTIAPKPVSITGTKVYDGTVNAYFGDNTTLQGVLPQDANKVYLASGIGQLAGKDVVVNPFSVGLNDKFGTQALTGTGTLDLGGTAQNNYVLTTDGSAWKVTPRPLVVWGNDYKITDGDSVPNYGYRVYDEITRSLANSNLIESITFSNSAVNKYNTIGWGTYPIEISNLSLNSNYSVAEKYNGTLLIEPQSTGWILNGLDNLDSIRANLNKNLPDYNQAISVGSPWVLMSQAESIYHDDPINGIAKNGGIGELKYIHPDGREVVFYGDTRAQVTRYPWAGTYNFANYEQSVLTFLTHGFWDVITSREAKDYYVNNLSSLNEKIHRVVNAAVIGEPIPEVSENFRHTIDAVIKVGKPEEFSKVFFDSLFSPENFSNGKLAIPTEMLKGYLQDIGGNIAIETALLNGVITTAEADFIRTVVGIVSSPSEPYVNFFLNGDTGVGNLSRNLDNSFYQTRLGKLLQPNHVPLPISDNSALTERFIDRLIIEAQKEFGSGGNFYN